MFGLSAAEASSAFDALSGEIYASAQSALLAHSGALREAMNSQLRAAFAAGEAAYVPVLAYGPGATPLLLEAEPGATLWGHGYGGWGRMDGDGNATGLSHATGGLLLGADGLVSDWRIGLLAGYGVSGFDVPGRASHGSSRNYHLGFYGGTEWGNIAFRSGLAYTWHDITTTRAVAFPGFTDTLSAQYGAGTVQTFGELGYRFETPAATFEPFANLAYASLSTAGFTETGAAAALTSPSQTQAAIETTLGLRASTGFLLGTVPMTASAMLGWRHAHGDLTPTATHALPGGTAFTITGAAPARDAALLEAGLDLSLSNNAAFGVTYSGQFSAGTQQHGFKVTLSGSF